jgi:hypothetical protein
MLKGCISVHIIFNKLLFLWFLHSCTFKNSMQSNSVYMKLFFSMYMELWDSVVRWKKIIISPLKCSVESVTGVNVQNFICKVLKHFSGVIFWKKEIKEKTPTVGQTTFFCHNYHGKFRKTGTIMIILLLYMKKRYGFVPPLRKRNQVNGHQN